MIGSVRRALSSVLAFTLSQNSFYISISQLASSLTHTCIRTVHAVVSLDVFDWRILANATRFLLVFSVVWVVNSVELYGFFLKYVLWVPPKNPMNTIRLLIWFGLGVPALREFYQFVSSPNTKRIGVNSWVSLAVFAAEVLLLSLHMDLTHCL